ncbi:MAG: VWA domain-containing protein [Candidatus Eisenbacteria bacterium]
MRFGAPHWLQLLWLLPLLAAWVIWSLRRRERDLARWCPPALQGRMTPSRRTWAGQARLVLLLLGVLFLVLAAARPQVGSRVLSVKRSGIDVIVALDLSESMLAEDLKPNRVTRARQEIQSLIDRLRGDRIGLVAFAGDAFVQCPLTLDYASARMFLRFMDTDLVPVPGTAIARAIEVATDAFEKSEDKFKALVLITDGEDHEGEVEAAVQKAKEAGVRIFAVGIGTQKGEPIPVRDDHGQLKDYKRDAKGEVILSQCDPAQLESICRATGGRYVDGSAGGLALDRLHGEIQGMEQKEMEGGVVTQYEDRYGYFVAAGFFFLVLEWLLSDRRRRRLSLARAAVLALVAAGAFAGGVRADDGKKLYEKGSYPEARDHYERYNAEHPQDARGDYDLGTTLHRTGELKPAEDALQRALRSDDPEIRSRAFYNLGNTQAKQGDLPAALESYKNALRIDPKDSDAKFNPRGAGRRLLRSSPPDSSSRISSRTNRITDSDQQDQNQQDQNQQDQDRAESDKDRNRIKINSETNSRIRTSNRINSRSKTNRTRPRCSEDQLPDTSRIRRTSRPCSTDWQQMML